MFSNEMSCVLARYPINPPAKVSPAPVGSKTSSNGSAGAKNTSPSLNSKAPCSPFLITTYLDPFHEFFQLLLPKNTLRLAV